MLNVKQKANRSNDDQSMPRVDAAAGSMDDADASLSAQLFRKAGKRKQVKRQNGKRKSASNVVLCCVMLCCVAQGVMCSKRRLEASACMSNAP